MKRKVLRVTFDFETDDEKLIEDMIHTFIVEGISNVEYEHGESIKVVKHSIREE